MSYPKRASLLDNRYQWYRKYQTFKQYCEILNKDGYIAKFTRINGHPPSDEMYKRNYLQKIMDLNKDIEFMWTANQVLINTPDMIKDVRCMILAIIQDIPY